MKKRMLLVVGMAGLVFPACSNGIQSGGAAATLTAAAPVMAVATRTGLLQRANALISRANFLQVSVDFSAEESAQWTRLVHAVQYYADKIAESGAVASLEGEMTAALSELETFLAQWHQ